MSLPVGHSLLRCDPPPHRGMTRGERAIRAEVDARLFHLRQIVSWRTTVSSAPECRIWHRPRSASNRRSRSIHVSGYRDLDVSM